MGEVIEIKKADLKHCSYYELGDDLGVSMLDGSIRFVMINDTEVLFEYPGGSCVYQRSEIGEFLGVSGIFIDSDQRYIPAVELVSRDYPGSSTTH